MLILWNKNLKHRVVKPQLSRQGREELVRLKVEERVPGNWVSMWKGMERAWIVHEEWLGD